MCSHIFIERLKPAGENPFWTYTNEPSKKVRIREFRIRKLELECCLQINRKGRTFKEVNSSISLKAYQDSRVRKKFCRYSLRHSQTHPSIV